MVGNDGFANATKYSRKTIKWAYFIEDYLWLVEGGVHPLQACDQIGINPVTAEKKLERGGYRDLANQLSRAGRKVGETDR
jgi:hypothetical protein